jgi:holin-like protein
VKKAGTEQHPGGGEPAHTAGPLLRALASLALVLLFLAAGEGAARLLRLPVPGSVVGMLLLLAALHAGWVRPPWVRPAGDRLLRWMGLFFVPPGVAVMLHAELLRREWAPVLAGSVAGTLAVLVVVGVLQQRLGDDG